MVTWMYQWCCRKSNATYGANFLACLDLQGVDQSAVAKFLPNFYLYRESLIALFREVPTFHGYEYEFSFFFSRVFYYSSEFLMDCSKLLGYLPDGLFVITSMSYCGGFLNRESRALRRHKTMISYMVNNSDLFWVGLHGLGKSSRRYVSILVRL